MAQDVYTYVPASAIDSVKKYGLLSGEMLLKNKDALLAAAKGRNEKAKDFRKSIQSVLSGWKSESARGPNVLFSPPPDVNKLLPNNPIRSGKHKMLRIALDKLLKDYPDTKLHGQELMPYEEYKKKWTPEQLENNQDDPSLRHRDLTLDEIKHYQSIHPDDLWSNYSDPEAKGMYAPNVPHAAIKTPNGVIPWKYIKTASFLDFLNETPENNKQERVRILLPGSRHGTYYLQKCKSGSKPRYRVPGGGIEINEDHQDAAVRELHEEFGIPPYHSAKHLKYLGRDHRDKYKNEHYYILNNHNVTNKEYTASNDPKEKISISEITPDKDNYIGPDLDIMLKHHKQAGFFDNYFGGKKDVDHPNTNNVRVREDDNTDSQFLINHSPVYRFVSLKDNKPTSLITTARGMNSDSRIKPDEAWLDEEKAEYPVENGESYFTEDGLKRYINSGLLAHHQDLVGSDVAILVNKHPKHYLHKSKHQIVLDSAKEKPDDIYWLAQNRRNPVNASDIINRYSKKPEYQRY